MTTSLIRKSFIASVPVMAGYLIIGAGFGIMLRNAGYGFLWAVSMSVFIYAGSMQFVGISLITAPASLVTAALSTLMINARHLFYGVSMIGRYKDAGKAKPYLIFSLTDETYALLSAGRSTDNDTLYALLVSLFDHIYWIAGTAAGSLSASALPFDTSGAAFSMTALFLASYTQQWLSGENRAAAAAGAAASLAALLIFGREVFLIPSMLLITLILLLFRKRFTGKEVRNDEQ